MTSTPELTLELYLKSVNEHKKVLKHIQDNHDNDLKERYGKFVEIETRVKNYLATLNIYDAEFLAALIETAKTNENDDWLYLPENHKYFDDLLGLRREISIVLDIDPNTPKHDILRLFSGIDEETYKKLEYYIPIPICHTDFLPYLKSL